MGERIHSNNCIWVFCCCGCLPILGLIKGLIIVGPIFIISLIGFTGVAIILLPHDIFLTYKSLLKTGLIGINLKLMGMLLLPIALLSWPILVMFVGSILGIVYGLFCPVVRTFDEDYNIITGGFADVFKDIFDFIKNFWKFNYHSYFTYLSDIERSKVDKPFDISIIQLIIGLILAIYGSIVGAIVLTLMWLIKLLPSIYRMYYYAFKYYCSDLNCLEKFMFLIFFIMALAVIPPIGILTILGYIGYGLYGGIFCAIEGYKHNICRGIISIWNTIRVCDEFNNEYIFDKKYTCFPDCSDYCLKKKKDNNSENKNINNENIKDTNPNDEIKKDDDNNEDLEVNGNKNNNKDIVVDEKKDNEENLVVNEKKVNDENLIVDEKKDKEENLLVDSNEDNDIKEKFLDNENKEEI